MIEGKGQNEAPKRRPPASLTPASSLGPPQGSRPSTVPTAHDPRTATSLDPRHRAEDDAIWSRSKEQGEEPWPGGGLPGDLAEVGDAAHDVADLAQQLQAVVALGLDVRVDHDAGEEGIDRGAQAGQGGHGPGEVFLV